MVTNEWMLYSLDDEAEKPKWSLSQLMKTGLVQ